MAKYRKKPIVVEAKLFEIGYIPKTNRRPAIKTLEGWYEVEVGKHYIVTGVKGERYPVEKEIFEETYELIEESGFHKWT